MAEVLTVVRRAESEADLASYAGVWNAITPREPVTVESTKRRLERQPERLYLVAEHDGQVVGTGFAGPSDSPGRAFFAVRVLPDQRRRGIGAALYEACLPNVPVLNASTISGRVSEADPESLRWATNRGFVEVARDVELVRELRADEFPAAPPPGIRIVELTEELRAAAYAVAVECWPDMATPEPMSAPPYEQWVEDEFAGPIAFAAFDGNRLVGYAALLDRPALPTVLEHGLSAVARSHRGRGIATALKRAEIRCASEQGFRELVTYTQEGNEPMRAINEKLGYLPQPAWILVRRALAE